MTAHEHRWSYVRPTTTMGHLECLRCNERVGHMDDRFDALLIAYQNLPREQRI